MNRLAAYDLPFDEQEQRVVAMAAEALELRHGAGEDPDGPVQWVGPEQGARAAMEMLRRVRARWSRVNELRGDARKYLGRVTRARDDATFALETVAARETVAISARNAHRQYVSRPEIDAEIFNASYAERRDEAKLRRLHSVVRDAYDLITDAERQLDALSVDLRRVVDLLGWESHLDG